MSGESGIARTGPSTVHCWNAFPGAPPRPTCANKIAEPIVRPAAIVINRLFIAAS
jgi:hypothetical protein